MIEPGLFVGAVMHRRQRPRRHRFEYRVFWLLLDLDSLCETASAVKLLSIERFNLISFYARDQADGRDDSLREKIASLVRAAGFAADGPIRLLTMPRVLGYVFNPLSVYFCHDARGRTTAIVWEVSNTFGERHSYVIGVDDPDAKVQRQRCMKELHVSPFMGMEIEYRFRVVDRGDGLTIGIADYDCDGLLMSATLTAERRPLTDRALLAAFLRMPFETVKVTVAIHWEALRLWLKGARFTKGPAGLGKAIERHSASALASARQVPAASAKGRAPSISLSGSGTPVLSPACCASETQADEREERGGREHVEFEQPSQLIGRQGAERRAAVQLNGDEGQKYQPDQAPGPPRLIRPE
jgi:uncharacterized protein